MKLKYYLRGLGIGMVVTALILGISNSNRQDQVTQTLSDEQVRERAAELGMVDSSELTLAALPDSTQQQAESIVGETIDTQETAEAETTAEAEATVEAEATAEPEVTKEPGATAEPVQTEETRKSTETVSIIINKGASSYSVSRQLQEAGLVEDAKAFDNYLCNNGYSRSISTGTYEIVPGTSEEEIAKIITGKH